MQIKIFICLCFFGLTQVQILEAQTKLIPYQELPTYNGILTGSGMYFAAAMNPAVITVTFSGPSDRWIGFGFGQNMYYGDALIYSNGNTIALHALGWYDYLLTNYGPSNITKDASQDWTILSNLVSAGHRSVVASRALNTSDNDDIAISYTQANLNIFWARGATADYTISYHGTANKSNGIYLPWLSAPGASFTASSNSICAGQSVHFTNLSTGGLTSYTWTFQGGNIGTSGAENPTVIYTVPGTYAVSLVAMNSFGTSSIALQNYITVLPLVAPSISIVPLGSGGIHCTGELLSFTTSVSNGGLFPDFDWKVNGVSTGIHAANFASNSLIANDLLTCEMTTSLSCATPSLVSNSQLLQISDCTGIQNDLQHINSKGEGFLVMFKENNLTIYFTKKEKYTILVHDLNGLQVKCKLVDHDDKVCIDLSELKSAVYFIQIIFNHEQVSNWKLIKN